MIVDFLVQKNKENSISEKIKEAFSGNPKKAYFFVGTIKDTGFKIIEEEIIDTKTKLYFYLGIDKKNTTRVMLDSLVKYSKEVYIHSNNEQIELNTNMIVFEYTNKAEIFTFSGDISEQDILDNVAVYNKITYQLDNTEEAKVYKKCIKDIISGIEDNFEELNKAKIDELLDAKEIFSTRQYVHSVKSIAELLGSSDNKKEEKEEVVSEQPEVEIPKVDLSSIDFDIDIDIPEEQVVPIKQVEKEDIVEESVSSEEKNDIQIEMDSEEYTPDEIEKIEQYNDEIDKDNELYDESLEDLDFDADGTLDINSLLLSKSNIELDVDEEDDEEVEDKNEDEIIKVKKVNLNSISNFIYELPSKPLKGQEVKSLKIPSYIQNMIPEFFELAEKGKNTKINDADYKVRNINLEIVDVKNNQKYTDREAKIIQKNGQSFMLISSEVLNGISYDEKDIARIIKLSSDIFHIEIISKGMQEYKIWSKVCNQKFKSADRHYGMM